MGKAGVRKALAGLVLAGVVVGGAGSGVASADVHRAVKPSGAPEPGAAPMSKPPVRKHQFTPKPRAETAQQATDRQVREMVNAVRATGTACSGVAMPAVPALAGNATLLEAAQAHSNDQAATGTMSHTGSNGSTMEQRVAAVGYTGWTSLAENVAAGQQTARAVVDAWLASSTGHCENLMSADLAEIGTASASNPATEFGIYWTMLLGRR